VSNFFSFFFKSTVLQGVDHAAVQNGDAKKVVELMRQDPGFKVNMGWIEGGSPYCTTLAAKTIDPP